MDDWPDELPAAEGDALIVAGLEGCLDVLSGEDAAQWLETDLREAVFSFQDFYEGQAGLILWAPSGSPSPGPVRAIGRLSRPPRPSDTA
ncbi:MULTISPECIES: hypothetical protein [unclassified Thiocapsa]|uniref:hypothetical protein n=1 Tax=unclassified Thiocapsa TaxID=2641286 RepID=UPI0035B25CB8